MHLTIESLFSDAGIVAAIIDRMLQTRKDRIYWQQYLTFRQTTRRVFKSYLGTVTGVMAGSINSRFGEKPIRERRNIGSGYGEIAYLGDAYQMSVDRLSELQDLIDKFNVAKPADQQNALNEIIAFVMDDFRQVSLAAHKRMDIVVGSLLMTGSAVVKNKDNRTDPNTPDLLEITLPFYGITPTAADAIVDGKLKFLFYLRSLVARLNPQFGAFEKMVMSLATFNKYIVGTSEFGETFRSQLGNDQFYLATGLIGSERASQILRTLGLPGIEIKEDYVEDQDGKNVQIYADDRISFLYSDNLGSMRWHTPYEATDPVPGRQYTPSEGGMLISNYRDKNGRYMEYTAEWIPEFTAPNKIVNLDLATLKAAIDDMGGGSGSGSTPAASGSGSGSGVGA